MAKRKIAQTGGKVTDVSVKEFSRSALYRYGKVVVEDRAIPDYRDGLKPVQRRVLWSMNNLNSQPNKLHKSARIIGDAIGKYHPHGDSSVYEALVTMTELAEPLVDGSHSNFGGVFNKAAAMRYTEACITQFTKDAIFDPAGLKIIDYVPNYDGLEKEPVVFPLLVPQLLINGALGIAVGWTTCIPALTIKSCVELMEALWKTPKISTKQLVKLVKFNHWVQPIPDSPKEYASLVDTGAGSFTFKSRVTLDKQRFALKLTDFAPGMKGSLPKILDDFSTEEWPEILQVDDETDVNSHNNSCFYLRLKRSISSQQIRDLMTEVENQLTRTLHYKIRVTHRKYNPVKGEIQDVSFDSWGIREYILEWLRWRIENEKKVLKYKMGVLQDSIAYWSLILLAAANLDKVTDALESTDAMASLRKSLNLTKEQAQILLNFRLVRLSKVDATKTKRAQHEAKVELQGLKAAYKVPHKGVFAAAKTFIEE